MRSVVDVDDLHSIILKAQLVMFGFYFGWVLRGRSHDRQRHERGRTEESGQH